LFDLVRVVIGAARRGRLAEGGGSLKGREEGALAEAGLIDVLGRDGCGRRDTVGFSLGKNVALPGAGRKFAVIDDGLGAGEG